MPNKQNLTLREAAIASGRSYWRLRAAAIAGDLRATQFTKGGKYYVRPEDLEAYFDSHAVSPLSRKAVAK